MKIPLSWLKEFLSFEDSAEKIAETLTSLGLEVDAIHEDTLQFEGLVVAEILATEPHPNAERLRIAKVFDGKEEFQVVCAAPNCRPGIKTAFAKVGSLIKDAEGKEIKIKKGKLRGIESEGMLCAHDELHLPIERYGIENGIMEFSQTIPTGTFLKTLFSDVIFEISLTPNLNYCSSVYGVARELNAILQTKLIEPSENLHEHNQEPIKNSISVSIENDKDCPRYSCRLIKEVNVGPSPEWLKKRLEQCGFRSVNNVVDATNYVLLEMGYPLHAFDYEKIDGKQIIVRNARKEERILAIDGKEYYPNQETLLICDVKKPLAIAGVIGGQESEVSETTKHVLLEAAYFTPGQIRRASKHLGIISEASKKFERGVDPNGCTKALNRAAELIQMLSNGKVAQGLIDIQKEHFSPKKILCRAERVNILLGTQLALSEMENLFQRLGFKTCAKGNNLEVEVPTYRNDISQEIDLIEEIARLYGYDNFKKTEVFYRASTIDHTPLFVMERQIRNALIGLGLQEFLTCDLISPEQADIMAQDNLSRRSLIKLLNPCSIEQSVMRTSLLPGLLQSVKHNSDYQNWDIHGFEIGKVHFRTKEGGFSEPSVVSIILTGKKHPSYWEDADGEVDFFDLKGMVENFFESLRISNIDFKKSNYSNFQPGRQAFIFINGVEVGSLGQVHPDTLRKLDIKHPVFFAEIHIQDLMQKMSAPQRMHSLPEFPSSERDWTVTVHNQLPVAELLNAIREHSSSLLEEVNLTKVYRNSEKLGTEWANLTFHFVYRDKKKTIATETVDKEHQRIIQLILQKFHSHIKS